MQNCDDHGEVVYAAVCKYLEGGRVALQRMSTVLWDSGLGMMGIDILEDGNNLMATEIR